MKYTSNLKYSALTLLFSVLLSGCGGGGTTDTVIDGIPFIIPSSYYELIAFQSSDPVYVNRDIFDSTTSASTASARIINGELGEFTSGTNYYFSDNAWLEYSLANIPVEFTEANTVITFNGAFTQKITSQKDISHTSINIYMFEPEISYLMPEGSELVVFSYKPIGTQYLLFSDREISTLDLLLESKCGSNSLDSFVDSDDLRGFSFTCGEESQTSGTLTGISSEFNTLVPNIGTWTRENLPDSNIEVIITNFDSSYLNEGSTQLTNQPIFSIRAGSVWEGRKRNPDYEYIAQTYNQTAFDAIVSAIGETEPVAAARKQSIIPRSSSKFQ